MGFAGLMGYIASWYKTKLVVFKCRIGCVKAVKSLLCTSKCQDRKDLFSVQIRWSRELLHQ